MHKLEFDHLMKHLVAWDKQLKAALARSDSTAKAAGLSAAKSAKTVAEQFRFAKLMMPNPNPVEEAFRNMLGPAAPGRGAAPYVSIQNAIVDAVKSKTDPGDALSPRPPRSPNVLDTILQPPVNSAQVALQAAMTNLGHGTTNPIINLTLNNQSPAAKAIDSLLSGKPAGDPMDRTSDRREHTSGGASSVRRSMNSELDPEEYELLKVRLRNLAHAANFPRSSHWDDPVFTANRGRLTESGAAITPAEIAHGRQTNWGRNAVTPATLKGVGDAIARILQDEITKGVSAAIANFLRQGYNS